LLALAKNVRVGFVANPLIVAFRGTKVLPYACASVRALAGYRAMVEYPRPSRDSVNKQVLITLLINLSAFSHPICLRRASGA
jgi:hypothetical protein